MGAIRVAKLEERKERAADIVGWWKERGRGGVISDDCDDARLCESIGN
jgi:hypothetical protein